MATKEKSTGFDESGNWNSAKRYSDMKIMEILEIIDRYETVAQFGFKTLEEAIKNANTEKEKINFLKVTALKFLVGKTIQVLRNSEFAIHNDKEKFNKILKKLLLVRDIIPKVHRIKPGSKATVKKEYYTIVKIVEKIKSELNTPLNKNNLIFMNKKEFDVKKAKEQFIEDLTTRG